MSLAVRHPPGDDRIWEQRLLPVLVMAFGVAVGATLAGARPAIVRSRPPPSFDTSSTKVASSSTAHAVTTAVAGFTELRIVDVVLNEGDTTSVVLLSDRDVETVIPLFVESADGQRIREQLRSSHSAADKLGKSTLIQTIEAMGGTAERIEVHDRAETSLKSQVVVRRGETSSVSVDARLSDALALAAGEGIPVYVERGVVAAEGITKASIQRKPEGFPSPLRRPESL